MTDIELALFLGLSPDEAAKIIPQLHPSTRFAYEQMAKAAQGIADYVAGAGSLPPNVLIDRQRPRRRNR